MTAPASPLASQLIDHLIRCYSTRQASISAVRSRSSAWCSLCFDGERHEIDLSVLGPGAKDVARRLIDGIAEVQFPLREAFVAEIAASAGYATPSQAPFTPSIGVTVEALTIRS